MGGRGGNSDGNQRRVSSRRVPGLPQLGDEGKPRRLSEEAARLQYSKRRSCKRTICSDSL